MEAAELTDKGSINQRAVLRRRAALVDALYAATPSPNVIVARPDATAEHAPIGGERAHG